MAFRNRAPQPTTPGDPEELFRSQFAGRPGAPAALWIHQGDVLRAWHSSHRDRRDVAIELPTGAGKTLVGALIAEWRRRANSERVAYLAPTRQLAQQTAQTLARYGLKPVLLIGRARDWSPADRALFESAGAVAVSVYSHVFNSNPAINADVLLLDDAHAAESYVVGPWNLVVHRADAAYQDVLAVLARALDPLVVEHLRSDVGNEGLFRTNEVFLASPTGVAAAAGDLESLMRSSAANNRIGRDASFVWRMLAGRLDRCMVYVAHRSIQIRPLIPPTGSHDAFELPRQRVYMSATLGSGGELERSFGRRKIDRIPVPRGWDKQGTGRRFFCFPEIASDLATDAAAADSWIAVTIRRLRRAVVLTPDSRAAKAFKERRLPDGFDVFEAADVEDDLEAFRRSSSGVLLLTNRYDGIDLPDDDCRLVVLQGLPARGDLQERFLHNSLGAVEVLQERLRARFVQGAGRATRNAGDFAVVIVAGEELVPYCTRQETKRALHPEVQAELAFGFDESLNVDSAAIDENIDAFLAQGDEWRDVDAVIVASRERLQRIDGEGTAELERAAGSEVAAWLSAWQGDWEEATRHARSAIDALRGGRQVQRYAALWNYLAAGWADRVRLATGDASWSDAASGYLRDARAAARGTSWVSRLAAPDELAAAHAEEGELDPLDATAVAGIFASLRDIGRASRFDEEVADIQAGLSQTEARRFERALVRLGALAGATETTGNGNADAAPDAVWRFGERVWVCWEAKSDAQVDGELGATTVRQANGHLQYTAGIHGDAAPSGSFTVLVSPQSRVHPAARLVASDNVYLIEPDVALELCDKLVRAWRTIRAQGSTEPSAGAIAVALRSEKCLPSQWISELQQRRLQQSEDEGP